MSLLRRMYQRSEGFGLLYEIEVEPGRYRVLHEGHVLKEASLPPENGAMSSSEEMGMQLAIMDIEDLRGMPER